MTLKRILILGLALVALVVSAEAGGPMRIPPNTCEEINCNARSVGGVVLAFPPFAYPWVGEFFAGFGQCIRLDVIEQSADMELHVISPNGDIFQNDNKGTAAGSPCPMCPLVKITKAPLGGWYTVRVGRSNGAAVNAAWTMLVSQYPLGNINCAESTAAMASPWK